MIHPDNPTGPVTWSMCECYVHPLVMPGYNGVGSCGRCETRPDVISYANSRMDAEGIFEDVRGRKIDPIP